MQDLRELHRLDEEMMEAVRRALADPYSHDLFREAMVAEKRFTAEANRLMEARRVEI